jgi:imidazoleglycerol phosphate synthase glutamine amidotransferase subunit HisH
LKGNRKISVALKAAVDTRANGGLLQRSKIIQPGVGAMVAVRKHLRREINHKLNQPEVG